MKLALICAISALAVALASVAAVEEEFLLTKKDASQCICTQHIAWVCATDTNGKLRQYGNSCVAKCAGATNIKRGTCPIEVVQPLPEQVEVVEKAEQLLQQRTVGAACPCPQILLPVCAYKDGLWNTYDNDCNAKCSHASSIRKGACPPGQPIPCSCPFINDPVCGVDGKQYPNSCLAQCTGVRFTNGPCKNSPAQLPVFPDKEKKSTDNCICPAIYSPVCANKNGVDQTYSSSCVAECDGASSIREKRCRKTDCDCTREFSPVCGENGEDYSNRCLARCDKQVRSTDGECRRAAQLPVFPDKEKKSTDSCICPAIYSPVCANKNGVDQTYSSSCVAGCDGASSIRNKKCRKTDCPCTREFAPVCGENGEDYSNKCLARCDKQVRSTDGECRRAAQLPVFPDIEKKSADPCICTFNYQPVCGTKDGAQKDYGNACIAECDNAHSVREGTCRKQCICGRIYSPVCGFNGKDYANSCLAKCEGQKYTNGVCQKTAAQLPSFPTLEKKTSEPCRCLAIYNPVCANDGSTYSNADCATKCGYYSNAKKIREGKCEDVCPRCPRDRSQMAVCDSNNVYYRNRCFAEECFQSSGGLYEPTTPFFCNA